MTAITVRAQGRAGIVLHTTEWMQAARRLYERESFHRAQHRDWEAEPDLWLVGYELDMPSPSSARSGAGEVPSGP